jgi:hypothetical protein
MSVVSRLPVHCRGPHGKDDSEQKDWMSLESRV